MLGGILQPNAANSKRFIRKLNLYHIKKKLGARLTKVGNALDLTDWTS